MSTARTNGRQAAPAYDDRDPDQRHDDGLLDRVIEATRHTVRDMEVMAKKAAASRMYGMDENQLFTLMALCEAEGLHPMIAVRRFHIIQGRPAMRTDAMLGEMMRHGWTVEWTTDSRDRMAQAAVFVHPRKCANGKAVSWTIEDARAAGLAGKDNWKNHTPAMLRSRVISTACRMLDPGIVSGIYSTDEVEEITASPAVAIPPERQRLRDSLDAARGRTPVPAPAPAPAVEAADPPRSDFGRWLDGRLAEVHARWTEAARKAGVDPGRPINRKHVANHLIKSWIEAGALSEGYVRTNGERDANKVAGVIAAEWDEDPAGLAAEIDDFLRREMVDRAEELGIVLPSDDAPDEAAAMADEDPADDAD